LTNVISDLSGLTGRTIMRAILAGERGPTELGGLHASEAEIAKSLEARNPACGD
jgi:hypothetical protein